MLSWNYFSLLPTTRSKIYRCDSNGAAMVAIDTLLTLMIFIVFIVFFSLHCLWSSWSSFSSLSPLSSLLQWLMVLEFVTNRWTYSHAMMLEMILHLRMETWILVWCYSTFSWVFDLWYSIEPIKLSFNAHISHLISFHDFQLVLKESIQLILCTIIFPPFDLHDFSKLI